MAMPVKKRWQTMIEHTAVDVSANFWFSDEKQKIILNSGLIILMRNFSDLKHTNITKSLAGARYVKERKAALKRLDSIRASIRALFPDIADCKVKVKHRLLFAAQFYGRGEA